MDVLVAQLSIDVSVEKLSIDNPVRIIVVKEIHLATIAAVIQTHRWCDGN